MTTRHDREQLLTAYALGEELSADERRDIEALLGHDEDARLEVESLREVAALLHDELGAATDDIAPLSDAIQQGIEARAADVAAARSEDVAGAPAAPSADAPAPAPDADAAAAADADEPDELTRARRARRRRRLVISGIALAASVALAVWAVPFLALRKQAPESAVALRVSSSPTGVEVQSREEARMGKRSAASNSSSAATTTPPTEAPNADPSALNGVVAKDKTVSGDLDDGERRNSATATDTTRAARSLVARPRFRLVARAPLSTFSVDVDTAAYANVRRYLSRNLMPPRSAVRVEEMINYFSYDYPEPSGKHPIGLHLEAASAPWNARHRLVRVALAAKSMRSANRPPSNLVFLIDVSGSMSSQDKLPLLRRALSMLVRRLGEKDRVAIVVYAGASGLVLPSTSCARPSRARVLSALERLSSGGSTNGGAGIQLAYRVAVANYIRGGINRVVLATDGDFNVGISRRDQLVRLIKAKARTGVYLSVLGFGMSRTSDHTLEQIADKGNGHFAFIDNLGEARKVLVDEINSTLVTVAKDVKIQVEFNPARVLAYRLIGYANRRLAARDFANDKKDAGEVGAGHRVTALYEVVPVGVRAKVPGVSRLKYAPRAVAKDASKELLTVKVRYKRPDQQQSTLMSQPLVDEGTSFASASNELRFAAAVAWFGEALSGSPFVERTPFRRILAVARRARGTDRFGYRRGFVKLVRRARDLTWRRRRSLRVFDAYK